MPTQRPEYLLRTVMVAYDFLSVVKTVSLFVSFCYHSQNLIFQLIPASQWFGIFVYILVGVCDFLIITTCSNNGTENYILLLPFLSYLYPFSVVVEKCKLASKTSIRDKVQIQYIASSQ